MDTIFWTEITKVFGGAAAFIAALVWLAKLLVSQWLKKDLEVFKSKVQSAATAGIEEVKSHLTQLSTEHEVRFTLLHTKRAEIISELYEKIVDAYSHTLVLALGAETTGIELHRQRAETAWEILRAALDLLYARKIWLPEALAQKVDDLLSELCDPSFKYHYYLKAKFTEQDVLDAARLWATKRHEVKVLIDDLEREFRKELAVMTGDRTLSNTPVSRTR